MRDRDTRTFVAVAVDLPNHPKLDLCGDLYPYCFTAFVSSLCYCQAHLTDGKLSKRRAVQIAAQSSIGDPTDVVIALIGAGLWIEQEDGSIEVHDYLKHNRSREEVERIRSANRRNGKLGGRPRKTESLTESETESQSETQTENEPSLSVICEPDPFDLFWTLYPKKESKGTARRAFTSALKKAPLEEILDGLKRYRFSDDRQYQPLASTWLNGERWQDWKQQQNRGTDETGTDLAALEAYD